MEQVRLTQLMLKPLLYIVETVRRVLCDDEVQMSVYLSVHLLPTST